ncbi:MAG: FMN-binding protein [Flavobacteriaceae bacterium]|nr:FMN-binding protein [Flavobacteriaceae bacterium]
MMKYLLIYFLLGFNHSFAVQNGVLPKNLEVKLDKVLNEHFNVSFGNKEKIIFSTEVQRDAQFNHEEDLVFKIKDLNANTVGFAYVGKAKSKIALYDYVVIFDKNLIITQIKILIYREDHGGEISSKRWLQQFLGFEKNQEIIYKKDIAGISGATISAISLTYAVNNVLKTVGKLHQLKLL